MEEKTNAYGTLFPKSGKLPLEDRDGDGRIS
jgi:hypothetical protein